MGKSPHMTSNYGPIDVLTTAMVDCPVNDFSNNQEASHLQDFSPPTAVKLVHYATSQGHLDTKLAAPTYIYRT